MGGWESNDRLSLAAAGTSRASPGVGSIPRVPGRPIDLECDALREGPRLDQVERHVRAGVGEESRALADDHGADEQGHLVDQVGREQPLRQGSAAVHLQLTPGRGLQRADGRREVAESPERTVVFAQCGSVSVFDATYLGFVFKAPTMGSSRLSFTPQ